MFLKWFTVLSDGWKCRRITLLFVYVGDEIMASKFVIGVGSKKHELLRCECLY